MAPRALINPTGRLVVAVMLRHSNSAKTEWFYNRNGRAVILKIDSKKVSKVERVEVRSLREAPVFGPDGKWPYVGDCMDADISALRVEDGAIIEPGTLLKPQRYARVDAREDAAVDLG